MKQIQEMERKGNEAIRKLRLTKLSNGQPFMINTNELPGYQCYLEYPDGSIELVEITKESRDFTVVKKLSQPEVDSLRLRYHLPR